MKWGELENFTWEELSHLTYGYLELSPTELLQKVLNEYTAEEIPSSVIYKLHHICESLAKACAENNIEVPMQIKTAKTKNKISKTEILAIIGSILTIIDTLTSLVAKIQPIQESHVHIQNNYTNTYITNEFNTDINYIIEELEQSQNITINIIDNSTDISSE